MNFPEFSEFDALGLADLIRRGKVSSREVTTAALERIERHNPVLNAVTFVDDGKGHVASSLDSAAPFCGVPMLIKDLGLAVAGWPRTSGSRYTAAVADAADCGLVARYRASGALPIGRATTSEFGILGTTETAAYGPTRNPWNLDHIAGGSSGGSASAVAAGLVPLAHGSDGLGSIRIPAACCGLVGLKPTRDRVPNLPDDIDYALGFVCDHVLTRTVRDSAAMLDVTGVPEPGSPYAPPAKRDLYLDEIARGPGKLRIRWSSKTTIGGVIDPDVEFALAQTAETLGRLGHAVEERPLLFDEAALARARLPISAANFAAMMLRTETEVGRASTREDLEPITRAALKLSRQVTGSMVMYGMQELRKLARGIVRQFDDFDVFLSPVMVAPPPRIGTIDSLSLDPVETDRLQTALYPYV